MSSLHAFFMTLFLDACHVATNDARNDDAPPYASCICTTYRTGKLASKSVSVPTVLVKYRCSHTVSSGRISVMNTLQSGKIYQIRINTIFIIALIHVS